MFDWLRRVAGAGARIGIAALATGCVLLPIAGTSGGGCIGQLLATTQAAGETCLGTVLAENPGIADWVTEQGRPDYVEAPSGSAVRLLYIDTDRVVTFERGITGAPAASISPRIRASDHTRFREDDKIRLARVRTSDSPLTRTPTPEVPTNGILRRRVGQDE